MSKKKTRKRRWGNEPRIRPIQSFTSVPSLPSKRQTALHFRSSSQTTRLWIHRRTCRTIYNEKMRQISLDLCFLQRSGKGENQNRGKKKTKTEQKTRRVHSLSMHRVAYPSYRMAWPFNRTDMPGKVIIDLNAQISETHSENGNEEKKKTTMMRVEILKAEKWQWQ